MRHARQALLPALTALVLAACGGGGGGGGAPAIGLSAGGDQSVSASSNVVLSATAQPGSGISAFDWQQTAGPAVTLDAGVGGNAAVAAFVAPDRSMVLEFEVTGRDGVGLAVARDRVLIDVVAARPEISAQMLASIDVRGGGPGRATCAALHRGADRLFIVDSVAGDVVVYDVSNPGAPTFAGAIAAPPPSPGYEPGPPLAVGCGETGYVAITWSGETTEFPGRIQFVDPLTLVPLSAISSFGAHPVDIDVTPDGATFAVACAGDAPVVNGGDGRGYVTIVKMPAGGPGLLDPHTDVAPIPFGAFDGREVELAQAGVRWFRSNNPSASIELTPRSVALSPDGSMAWVACPENDALIVVDTISELATDCVALDDRRWGTFDGGSSVTAVRAEWSAAPPVLSTPAGDDIAFGGVTGIASASQLAGAAVELTVIAGAGPVLAPIDVGSNGALDLPMVDPDRQLRVQRIVVDGELGSVEIASELLLRDASGAPVTGRPSLFAAAPGLALHDEVVVTLDGVPVGPSTLGARFNGATIGANQDIWLAEARRCGLWRFDATGRLITRFVPLGTPIALGQPTLPATFARRRANLDFETGRRFGGFGAIAYDASRGVIVAATRLPLDNPDTPGDTISAASAIVRLIEIDATTGATTGEYALVLDAPGHSIEGMAIVSGDAFDGGLALLEAAAAPSGFRGIHLVELAGATNLRTLSGPDYAAVDAALESTGPGALGSLTVPVVPARKTLRVDLTDAGLGGGGRPSGLAALGSDLIVTFDDGSQIEQASVSGTSGRLLGVGGPKPSVARITLSPAGLDAASTGGGFTPQGLPVQGLVQPLDLAAYTDRGVPRLALANGGLPRILPSVGGQSPFDERERVGDLVLDTLVFPGAAALQMPDAAGDLLVSSIGADSNGDMLVDRLQAFGARSIGVRDMAGAPLWSSSERLVRRAARERGDLQRANATRSGIRPRAVAVGTVGGVRILVTALEGGGLVVAHDLGNATAPLFAGTVGATDAPVDVDLAGTLMATTDATLGRVDLSRLVRN